MKDPRARILVGTEIETYSISTDNYRIGRRLSRPKPGISESGEKFTRDASIGSEYNSRPFHTVREALFLLKSGLRKYLRGFYRGSPVKGERLVPLLVGGWTDRTAGAHIHLSVAGQVLTKEDAASLAAKIHDHIPLLMAIGANSPVWNKRLTSRASMRILRGSDIYFKAAGRGRLSSDRHCELVYNPGRKTKPPTLELRILDSNIPEFLVAAICIVKAAALNWLDHRRGSNRLPQASYLAARKDAAERGMKARLFWKDEELTVAEYLDRFLWVHRRELEMMDIPEDVFETFRLLKRGYNGSRIIHEAVKRAMDEHPQTWQRRFARRYTAGLHRLLSGNTLEDFARHLKVELPSTENVWLGRKRASL